MPSPSSKQRRQETCAGGLLEHALLEVRPRLRSAYCFLRLSVDTEDPTFRVLSVQTRGDRGGLELTLEYRGRVYTEPVQAACRLAALSGGVAPAGRYATLRATLEPDQRCGSAAAEVLTPVAEPPAPPPLWRPVVPARYRAVCRQCGATAVDTRFRRALPLPSENWREMLGNVFCHGDGADRDMHERVRARPGDCFYAASHVVLSAEEVRCAAADSRLSCAECAAPLGEKVEFGSRLWHHRLTWSCGGEEELRLAPDQVLRRLLVHGAASCDAPAARLLASAPRHDDILLWLIDTSLTVHLISPGKDGDGGVTCNGDSGVSSDSTGNNTSTASSGDDSSRGVNGVNGSSTNSDDASHTNGLSASSSAEPPSAGRARTAVKILYRSCDEEEARQHRADLAVQSLELDEVLMVTLRAELERSQRWYPEPQRTQGQDRVGLIVL
ncbi:uncharacterized protein LOC122365779 [Amphibalanus amphitrite]|uniref:uncharacterized protein LOC122365779 n=1 Tax=Amphibalanus amphitrite TaxID=1232801 RepID=UPI001C90363A|nr:uncharacterized protein LOC122365779 [Amphibalanus amphitrite]